MKKSLITILVAVATATGSAIAQNAGAVTPGVPAAKVTHTYEGSVVAIYPEDMAIAISQGGENDTVTYQYSENTKIVDPEGNMVDIKTLAPESSVAVQYIMDGDIRRVERIISMPAPGSAAAMQEPTTTP